MEFAADSAAFSFVGVGISEHDVVQNNGSYAFAQGVLVLHHSLAATVAQFFCGPKTNADTPPILSADSSQTRRVNADL